MMRNFTTLPPLSLYIHYPWCVKKCPYCDFNSHTISKFFTDKQHDQLYTEALILDLQQELPAVWGRTINSIFIGGGTPSLIAPEALYQLLNQISALLPLSPFAEITLEANPGTIESNKFVEFRSAGVNRLSIGIQSFQDHLLTRIGRIHDSKQARHAVEQAQLAGFDNINLDLMYGLPNQTCEEAINDLQQALDFKTTHLSHYQLTLEPNTLFAAQPPTLPNDEQTDEMLKHCQQLLHDDGFEHYEISAYAQQGKQCQHNLNYWHFGDYLGIGAGAHGKISDANTQIITRRWKEKHPQQYIEKYLSPEKTFDIGQKNSTNSDNFVMMAGEQHLSDQDTGFEFMLNASRLLAGFDTKLFTNNTGLDLDQISAGLQKAVELELIEWHQHHIKPTERGLRYLNELQAIFL